MSVYRSPYEAYTFLSDASNDLRCDFEILTDRISSETGLLASLCPERREELLKVDELIYHANPSLRTKFTIRPEEIEWLNDRVQELGAATKEIRSRFILPGGAARFVLPAGSTRACVAHILRTDGKKLVRMLYRHAENGGKVAEGLFDFANLVSGYFFFLALWLNIQDNVAEVPFDSRNYR